MSHVAVCTLKKWRGVPSNKKDRIRYGRNCLLCVLISAGEVIAFNEKMIVERTMEKCIFLVKKERLVIRIVLYTNVIFTFFYWLLLYQILKLFFCLIVPRLYQKILQYL